MRLTAIFLLLALPLSADVIHLKSGGRLEGIVRNVRPGSVTIETLSGTISIPRSNVLKIDREDRSVLEEYYERKAAADSVEKLESLLDWVRERKLKRFETAIRVLLRERNKELFVEMREGLGDDPSADDLFRLGAWARRHDLPDRARDIFEEVLQVDHDHDLARRELGFKRYDGQWLTEEEVMLAKGFVKFESRWVTQAEKDLILEERSANLRERARAIRDEERRLERQKANLGSRESKVAARERAIGARESETVRIQRELGAFDLRLRALDRYYTGVFGNHRDVVSCRGCRIWYSSAFHRSCPFCAYKQQK